MTEINANYSEEESVEKLEQVVYVQQQSIEEIYGNHHGNELTHHNDATDNEENDQMDDSSYLFKSLLSQSHEQSEYVITSSPRSPTFTSSDDVLIENNIDLLLEAATLAANNSDDVLLEDAMEFCSEEDKLYEDGGGIDAQLLAKSSALSSTSTKLSSTLSLSPVCTSSSVASSALSSRSFYLPGANLPKSSASPSSIVLTIIGANTGSLFNCDFFNQDDVNPSAGRFRNSSDSSTNENYYSTTDGEDSGKQQLLEITAIQSPEDNTATGTNLSSNDKEFKVTKCSKRSKKPEIIEACSPCQCTVCLKVFSSVSALAKHKLTHSNERNFHCLVCNKAFKRQDHLNSHMLTHRRIKPFECVADGCDKSYCDARSLRRHTEIHHIKDQNQLKRKRPSCTSIAKTGDKPTQLANASKNACTSSPSSSCIKYAPPSIPAETSVLDNPSLTFSASPRADSSPSQRPEEKSPFRNAVDNLNSSQRTKSVSISVSLPSPMTAARNSNETKTEDNSSPAAVHSLTIEQIELIDKLIRQKILEQTQAEIPDNNQQLRSQLHEQKSAMQDASSQRQDKYQLQSTDQSTTMQRPQLTQKAVQKNAPSKNKISRGVGTGRGKKYQTKCSANADDSDKPEQCNLCHKKFKNIPALNGHMRLHGGYFRKLRQEMEAKKAEKKSNSRTLQTASINVRALIEEKIIQKRINSLASNLIAEANKNKEADKNKETTNNEAEDSSKRKTSENLLQQRLSCDSSNNTDNNSNFLSSNVNFEQMTSSAFIIPSVSKSQNHLISVASPSLTISDRGRILEFTTRSQPKISSFAIPSASLSSNNISNASTTIIISEDLIRKNSARNAEKKESSVQVPLIETDYARLCEDEYPLDIYQQDGDYMQNHKNEQSDYFTNTLQANDDDMFSENVLLNGVDATSDLTELSDIPTVPYDLHNLPDFVDVLNSTDFSYANESYIDEQDIANISQSSYMESESDAENSIRCNSRSTEAPDSINPADISEKTTVLVFSQSPIPSPDFTYPTPPASHEEQSSPSFHQIQIHHDISSPLSSAFYSNGNGDAMSSPSSVEAVLNELLPMVSNSDDQLNDRGTNIYPSTPDEFTPSSTDNSCYTPPPTAQSSFIVTPEPSPVSPSHNVQLNSTNQLSQNDSGNITTLASVAVTLYDDEIKPTAITKDLSSTGSSDANVRKVFKYSVIKSNIEYSINKTDCGAQSFLNNSIIMSLNHGEVDVDDTDVTLHISDDDADNNDDKFIFNPIQNLCGELSYTIPSTSQMTKRCYLDKQGTGIPYKSRLRDHKYTTKFSSYTPPPLLNPNRNGSGLFWNTIIHPSNTKLCDATNILKSDEDAHINIGADYQADLSKICTVEKCTDINDNQIWDPKTASFISTEELELYLDLACCTGLPGGGQNKEYALNLLQLCQGDIQDAIDKLLLPKLYLPTDYMLLDYSYSPTKSWSIEEIETFQKALLKYDKCFHLISKEVKTKSTKQCVQFYYLWKKGYPENYTKMKQHWETKRKSIFCNGKLKMPKLTISNNSDSKQYSCEYENCIASFNSKAALYGHIKIHSSISCTEKLRTGATVTNNNSIINNCNKRVENTDEFPCKECGRIFSKIQSRSAHMRYHRQPSESDNTKQLIISQQQTRDTPVE